MKFEKLYAKFDKDGENGDGSVNTNLHICGDNKGDDSDSSDDSDNSVSDVESENKKQMNIPLWIQFILSATIVTLITYLARNVSYKYASIIYSLPYTFLILVTIFIINNFSRTEIRKFAFNVILALLNIVIYSSSVIFLQNYTNISVNKSIILAFIPWALFALVIYYEPYRDFVKNYVL